MNINRETGRVCHGVGGGLASVDNVAFGRGAVGGWINNDEVLYANGDDAWMVSAYNVNTKQTRRLLDLSANFLLADGGGHWATWLDGSGLQSSSGFTAPLAAPLGVGANGTLIYKPRYQSYGPTVGRELDGTEFPVCAGHAYAPQVVGPRQVVFTEDGPTNGITTLGLPKCGSVSGSVWKPRAAFVGGQWWITYYSDTVGIVLHPFDSFDGFSILPTGDGWHSMAAIGPDTVRVLVAVGEGEQAGDLWGYDINVTTREVTLWASSIEPTFVPVYVEDCRTINAGAAVTPIAPDISTKLIVGAFLPAPDTPGNLTPYGGALLPQISDLGQADVSRILGIWVDEGPTYTLTQRIAQSKPTADELQVPLVIYVDDRDYLRRLAEILPAVGSTPWIAHVQCYIDRRVGLEDASVDSFAAEVAAQVSRLPVPWLAAIRCTTPAGSGITVDRVVGAMNRLVPVVALPNCLGWALWAWTRADGVTGVPGLLPAALAWLTGTPQLQPENARTWAAAYCASLATPEPLSVTILDFTSTGTAPLPVIVDCKTNATPGASISVFLNGQFVSETFVVGGVRPERLTFDLNQPGEYRLKARVRDGDRVAETGAVRIIRVLPAPPKPEIPGITYPSQPGSGTVEGARKPSQDAADAARKEEGQE